MTDSPDIANIPLRHAPPLELELKFLGAEHEGVFSGYASVWAGQPGGEPDAGGDQIAKGAYSATLAAHKAAGTWPVMLDSHRLEKPIGRWMEIREDERGLHVRGKLNLESAAGRETFLHLKSKDINGLSIGYRIADGGYQLQKDGSRLLTALDLFEISVVSIPMAPAARITQVKSIQTQRDLEQLIHEVGGVSRRAAKAMASKGFSAIAGDDQGEVDATEALRRIKRVAREVKAEARAIDTHTNRYNYLKG